MAYTASAVNFNGSTYLHIDALASSDNEFISQVLWFKTVDRGVLSTVDTADAASSYMQLQAPNPESGGVNIEVGNNGYTSGFEFRTTTQLQMYDDTWHSLIMSADAGHPAGSKIVKVFLDDIEVPTNYSGDIDNDAAFIVGYNGLSLHVAGDGSDNFTGCMADIRIMPGISLLTGGNISEATRRLFIDANGKPVDPDVATTALGTPAVLFSGNATEFVTNQGSGGAFTLTGSLTDCDTSPSGGAVSLVEDGAIRMRALTIMDIRAEALLETAIQTLLVEFPSVARSRIENVMVRRMISKNAPGRRGAP